MSEQVRNNPPPVWLVQHVVNPLLRRALPTRLGTRIPLGLLRVTGRRSGRRYEIPVGAHDVPDGRVVFSDAPWIANFRGGADAELVLGGRLTRLRGELVQDPARIGGWMRLVLDAGLPPRRLGLQVPPGHRITDEEAAALRSAVLLR